MNQIAGEIKGFIQHPYITISEKTKNEIITKLAIGALFANFVGACVLSHVVHTFALITGVAAIKIIVIGAIASLAIYCVVKFLFKIIPSEIPYKKIQPSNIITLKAEPNSNLPKMNLEPTTLLSLNENSPWVSHCRVFKLQELKEGLATLAKKIQEELKDTPYAASYIPKKSSRWCFEYAQQFLNQQPQEIIEHRTDDIKNSGKSIHTDNLYPNLRKLSCSERLNVQTVVLFDDASYSGRQLVTIINSIGNQAKMSRRQINLYLAVPFVSNAFLKLLNDGTFRPNFNVKLFTTDQRVLSVKEAQVPKDLYIEHLGNDRCAAITEWKCPDGNSIPVSLSQDVSPKNHVACYKL